VLHVESVEIELVATVELIAPLLLVAPKIIIKIDSVKIVER